MRQRVSSHIEVSARVCQAVLLAAVVLWPARAAGADKVSAFGRYSGYNEAAYDGWVRRAEYAPMPDGVQLAVNYFVPTSGGQPASEPLPVLLVYTRYSRVYERDGGVVTPIETESFYRELLRHGYIIAIANARGTGASFGTKNGPHSAETTSDSWYLVEWLATQPWCDGHVGMMGRSNSGINAIHAATQAPPHLDAVFSEMAGPSTYDFAFRGGTFKQPFIEILGALTRAMDLGRVVLPARMDGDRDGSMRDAAVAEHADNLWVDRIRLKKIKFRDSSITRANGSSWSWQIAGSIDDVAALRRAAVPLYHLIGWYDSYTTQQAWTWANLPRVPQKLTIGPWAHQDGYGEAVHTAEALRWFDYWLKGIDNGIMREKPVHYYLMRGNKTVPEAPSAHLSRDEIGAQNGRAWKVGKRWPPPKARPQRLYLTGGPSGTVTSPNDGRLAPQPPAEARASDEYRIDYTSTMGSFSRWMNSAGFERDDPPGTTFFDERTAEDQKALTYTSAPFAAARAIVGYPVIHLWVTSSHRDGDFFVYLEEVDGEGNSHYVTEGALRASFRALADEAPWRNFGLPYHRCFKKDQLKRLPSEPVELVFDLMGTAIVIDAGHRIRVTVAGADALNHALYPSRKGRKAPTIAIHRDTSHRSYVELPMMRP